MAVFDSQNLWFKSKIGPIEKGQLQLKIKLEKRGNLRDVNLILFKLGEQKELKIPMKILAEENGAIIYSIECSFEEEATYEYFFEFLKDDKKYYVRRFWGSFEGQVTSDLNNLPWRLTVYEKIKTHPTMKKGIMYQIFPDRFRKGETESKLPEDRIYRKWGEMPYYDKRISTDFFGGNFNGIADVIEYLKKLKVSAIYSNPIVQSSKNHRYATMDYKKVDPVLGTEEEFKNLINKLHKNGMLFILDGVFNHVGSDSIYFDKENQHGTNGAYQSENSPFRGWFYFNKENPTEYADWWGDQSIPKLNYSSESLREYILGKEGVLRYWYQVWNIDGVREDVADELQNEVREEMYQISVEERGDKAVVIPEVWEDASCKWAYSTFMEYMQGKQATSVMNYPIRDLILPYIRYGGDWAIKFKNTCLEIFKENYPKEVAYSVMNFLSTHDTVRAITKLVGPEKDDHSRQWQTEHNILSKEEYILGRSRLLLAYTAIFFLPGIPSIYYGDEVGMQGMADPFCRACFPWDRMDKKILKPMRRLCATRFKKQKLLAEAEFDILVCQSDFLLYERTLSCKKLRVCLNFSTEEKDITSLFAETKVNGETAEEVVKQPKIIFQIKRKQKDNAVRTYTENGQEKKKIVLSGLNAIVYEV